ncbi:Bug family tripartite tricarboxylate transporter substrate binding protein [Ramlibacter sp.]|uniref:Bug family tripartite tricarboxylate transporter substrate binding protein n=1 Tax=Ramlibacter sp. TaxID=1917967 RepID=UPI003D0F9184
MTMHRRQFVAAAFAGGLLPWQLARAQAYPSRSIRIVLPAPPGNTSDAAVRLMAQKLAEKLGQAVVVDNRAGGSGVIGMQAGLRSPADGYTLTMISSTSTVAAVHLIKQLPYQLTDMAPISSFFSVPSVLVGSKAFAPNTFKEVMDLAKAKPGTLNIAYSNATGAVAAASLKQIARIDVTAVAYKAGAQAVTDLLGGQVPLMINDVALTLPHIKAGSVKPYAVTSAKRSSVLPDVPTLSELLPEPLEFFGWTGFAAPVGTPQPVIARLNTAINEILRSDDMLAFLRNMGADPVVHAPEQLSAYIRSEEPRWGRALKAAGIQPE